MQKPPIPERSRQQALLQRRWVRLLLLLILIVAVGILAIPRFMGQTPVVKSSLPPAEHATNIPSPPTQLQQKPTTQAVVLPRIANSANAQPALDCWSV